MRWKIYKLVGNGASMEPATTAKVVLETGKGPLAVELWAQELPLNCRFFLKRCVEGAFAGFGKISKDFIQCEVKNRNEKPEKREFNTRIRPNKRGLVCMGNFVEDDPKSGDFFVTLKPMPEINQRYTIIGKIVDNSVFTAVRIGDSEIVEGEQFTPIYETKITKCKIEVKYFNDIVEEKLEEKMMNKKEKIKEEKKRRKKQDKGVKKKVKLSYDDDDEDGEEDFMPVKLKSAHELMKGGLLVEEGEKEREGKEGKKGREGREGKEGREDEDEDEEEKEKEEKQRDTLNEANKSIASLKQSIETKGTPRKSQSLLSQKLQQFKNSRKDIEFEFREETKETKGGEDDDELDFMNHKLDYEV